MSNTTPDVKGDYIEETINVWDKDTKTFSNLVYHIYSFSEFPRGKDGDCAFCKGDPCAEQGEGLIAIYFAAETWDDTCPVCRGRAS